MTTSWRVRAVAAALGAVACLAVPNYPAAAQAIPVRVVQSGDGTLYLVRDGNAWPLVPEPISDADLAALALGGEVDGTLPADWLSHPAPAAAEPPAEPPAPPAAQTPAPPVAAPAAPLAPTRGGSAGAPPPTASGGGPTAAAQTGSTPATGGGARR